ncbi:hypothetical protein Tco_0275210, partial [Tanacetum coccineum]
VFGKPILQELITEAIQNSEYYYKYLEMTARKPAAKEGGKKKTTSKADNPQKPISAKQSKPALAKLMRYFTFGRHLDELHVTWAHLEKKRTRLQTNTKTLEDL